MPIILQTRVRSRIRGLSRSLSQISKEAMRDAAMRWHGKILPKHFGSSAPTEYRHQPRQKGWTEAKRNFGKGQGRFRDLMLTGQSRRFLQSTPRVSSTSKRATLHMNAPRHFKINPPHQPDKVAELTRISGNDRTKLSRFTERRIGHLIKLAQRKVQPETKTI